MQPLQVFPVLICRRWGRLPRDRETLTSIPIACLWPGLLTVCSIFKTQREKKTCKQYVSHNQSASPSLLSGLKGTHHSAAVSSSVVYPLKSQKAKLCLSERLAYILYTALHPQRSAPCLWLKQRTKVRSHFKFFFVFWSGKRHLLSLTAVHFREHQQIGSKGEHWKYYYYDKMSFLLVSFY